MSKYLTYQERLEIEAGLKENLSFGVIALKLNKDRTTIAKEIKRHTITKKTGYSGGPYNACKLRPKCKKKNICPKGECRRASATYCKLCSYCNECCPDFQGQVCISQFKLPYVCNGCRRLDNVH